MTENALYMCQVLTVSLSFSSEKKLYIATKNKIYSYLHKRFQLKQKEIIEITDEKRAMVVVCLSTQNVTVLQQEYSTLHPNITMSILHNEIDWQAQAATYSPFWSEEKKEIHIQLKNGASCYLKTGNAFGDGSHPTTRLMLENMQQWVCNKTIIDIGSGNGVLAICAKLYGASRAIGIEIDERAIQIAVQNSQANSRDSCFCNSIIFMQPHAFFSSSIYEGFIEKIAKEETLPTVCLLINMIWAELQHALPSYINILHIVSALVISGILTDQVQECIAYITRRTHLKFFQSTHEGQWWCLVFSL